MAPVTVTVRLSGALAERLGPRRAVELPGGATVADLVGQLAVDAGLEPADAGGLAVVADGSFLVRSRPLADGERLEVLVPVAGG